MTTTVDPNYWSLLGVSPECDSNELKSAFRKEARKWHPDLNKNDANAEERFKLINEAYAILSDPKKRQEWDALVEYGAAMRDDYFELVIHLNILVNPFSLYLDLRLLLYLLLVLS